MRPSASVLLARRDIAAHARDRAAVVEKICAACDTTTQFPLPRDIGGVCYNAMLQNAPAGKVVRNLFDI
jgi:hypothetical protein